MIKIDMIQDHSPEGVITPLRLRLKEDGELKAFDVIDPVLYDKQRTQSKNTVLRYKAKININDSIRNIELYFCVELTRWEMKI